MVDERRRVIADLLVRLSEAGIEPESQWTATFLPGVGWAFEAERRDVSPSSSAGVADATTKSVQPAKR